MIYNIYTFIELLSLFVMIRGSILIKNRGIKDRIIAAFCFVLSLGLMYMSYYNILPSTVEILSYLVIIAYIKKMQNKGWLKAILAYIFSVITIAVIEFFISSIVFFINENEKYKEYNILVTCFLVFIIILILSKKVLSKLFIEIKNLYINHKKICTVALFLIIAELIILKIYSKLPAIQVFLIAGFAIAVAIILFIWQWDKKAMRAKMEQMKIESIYNDAFKSVIKDIRRKQHDFYNHINAICSLYITTNSYDELVERLESYGRQITDDKIDIIFDENSSPVIIGFLYTKLSEAKEKGIDVDTKIAVGHAECKIPEYKIIEMLGILIDNAIEALEEYCYDVPVIKLTLIENVKNVIVQVDNKSPYIENSKIQQFFEQGFSTKNKGRGLGLYNIKEMVKKSGSELIVQNIEEGQDKWFSIRIEIEK